MTQPQVTERAYFINVAEHYENLDFLLFPATFPLTSGDFMHFNGDPAHCLSSVDNGATGIDYKYAALGNRSSQGSPFSLNFDGNFAPLPDIELGASLISITQHMVAKITSGGLNFQAFCLNLAFGSVTCTADGTFHDNTSTVLGSSLAAVNLAAVLRALKHGQFACAIPNNVSAAQGIGTIDAVWLDVTYANP